MTIFKVITNYVFIHILYLIYKIRYSLSEKKNLIVLIDNDSVCKSVLKHIDEYSDFYALDKIILFTNNEFVLKNYSEYVKKTNVIIKLIKNEKQSNFFINCIRFNMRYILLPSINYPDEKNLKNLIGVNGITEEDLVFYCELRLFTK